MYLVEPEAGQRCHYTSARALGAAIRRGELGPQARIFHQTSDRWLPITVHPEYRRAESEWEESSARQLRARRWTFLAERSRTEETKPESPHSASPVAVPMLVSDEPETSWLGSAFRSLRQLTRVSG